MTKSEDQWSELPDDNPDKNYSAIMIVRKISDDKFQTEIDSTFFDDAIKTGVTLASCARTIIAAAIDLYDIPEGSREQMEAEVRDVFCRDLGFGDMGEADSIQRSESG